MVDAETALDFTCPPKVLYLYCNFKSINKYKFIVMVYKDAKEILFFLINSKSYWFSQTSEIKITHCECSFLDHDSYVDCNELFILPKKCFIEMISKNINDFDKGYLDKSIAQKMVEVIQKSETISQKNKKKIIGVLTD